MRDKGRVKFFALFRDRRPVTSALSVHNDEMYTAWIPDPPVFTPGFHDRKLSGLYQSFTYVFDILPRVGGTGSEMLRAMFVNVENRCSRNNFSVFSNCDVTV